MACHEKGRELPDRLRILLQYQYEATSDGQKALIQSRLSDTHCLPDLNNKAICIVKCSVALSIATMPLIMLITSTPGLVAFMVRMIYQAVHPVHRRSAGLYGIMLLKHNKR